MTGATRGAVTDRTTNRWLSRRSLPATVVFLGLLVLPLVAVFGAEGYVLSLVTRIMILAIAAISLDLLVGQAGLVSFGHAAFLGLGAYTTGIMLTEGVTEVALILPMVVATSGAFALLTGLVCLRTSGVYFIMITLAFGQMLFFVASSLSAYGGDDGLTLWASPTLLGTELLASDRGLYAFTFVALFGSFLFAHGLRVSRFGRVLRATRENELRCAALGYDVVRIRIVAYVIAGTLAGIAGCLLALQAEFVSPATMSWQRSGELIAMVVLGGMGTPTGALLGAIAFALLEVGLADVTQHWKLVFGPLLVLAVIYFKGGLAGLVGVHDRDDHRG
ncbi:MAG: branched-chain amino acid ABC transporter permease [Pseudomonadota bacterium]